MGRSAPDELADLIRRTESGELSRANAREAFDAHVETGEPVATIVERRGFRQISDASAVAAIVDQVIAANPAAVADYRAGKGQAIGFLVGQVMKASRGQANPALATEVIRERLGSTPDGVGA